MAGKSGRNVTYAVQEEPAFIKRFKEKIGYKEDPGIDEKRQKPASAELSDDEDTEQDCAEDEKPVVVVLRPGDLTAEEAEEHAALEGHQEPGAESFGRIVFRKPSKRSSDANNTGLSTSSVSKKAKTDKDSSHRLDNSAESDTRTDRTGDKVKANSSLLSFDDDDGDDDDS